VGHQHTGGRGIRLVHLDNPSGAETATVCESLPRYGTGDEAGNEKGHGKLDHDWGRGERSSLSSSRLACQGGIVDSPHVFTRVCGWGVAAVVAMSTCTFGTPVRIKAGQWLGVVSEYDAQRTITGVMGLVYITAAKAQD
jgi:hypothetical protein